MFALVLGKVISHLREQRGMSQGVLAYGVGISQPVMSRIEAGKVQPDAFLYGRLATALGITVQDLDRHVHDAIERTKRAATAVTDHKPWKEALAVAGVVGLVGLIGFAVAAMLDSDDSGKPPSKPPTRS